MLNERLTKEYLNPDLSVPWMDFRLPEDAMEHLRNAKTVLEFLILIYEELGSSWINPNLLRIGASSLLIDIERQLYHFSEGRYANKEKIAMS